MVHGEHGIQVFEILGDKQGVRGHWAADIYFFGLKYRDGRRNVIDLLGTKIAPLPCMRIQTAHGDPGLWDTKAAAEILDQDTQDPDQMIPADKGTHLRQGNMGGREGHAQAWRT